MSAPKVDDPEVEVLRERIRSYLTENPSGRRRLASAIGVDESWISRFLKGDWHTISFSKIKRAALAMDVPLYEILIPALSGPEQLLPPFWVSALTRAAQLQGAEARLDHQLSRANSAAAREVLDQERTKVRELLADLFKPRLSPTHEQLMLESEQVSSDGLAALIALARALLDANLAVDPGRPDPSPARCALCRRGVGDLSQLADGACQRCLETRATSMRLKYERNLARHAERPISERVLTDTTPAEAARKSTKPPRARRKHG